MIYIINASPRKNMNTKALLSRFQEGVEEAGTQAEMINLYELEYHGCRECYACKLVGGSFYGQCGQKDDLTPVLQKLLQADGIAFGSPVFFADVTGELRCFMERLLYPLCVYMKDAPKTIAPKQIPTVFIYTMNAAEETAQKLKYDDLLMPLRNSTKRVFGYEPKVLYSYYTYQYIDYSRYAASLWDLEAKKKQRDEQFPIDLEEAFHMGQYMGRMCRKDIVQEPKR